MKNIIKKYAFSLAEAIILTTVLAVVLTASTPFLTRKLVNVAESGSASHGRYEIFMQEFIKFNSKCNTGDGCKKIYKSSNNEAKRYVTVYQKLSDAEYHMVMKKEGKSEDDCKPKIITKDNRNYKSTLYAVVDEKAELISSDNSMTLAKGEHGQYQRSSKIIFEPSDVTYDGIDNNQRVIEGNLTDKYMLKLSNKFKTDYNYETQHCYIIDGKNEGDFNGTVKIKPWIRKIVGKNRIVEDREIEAKDKENGAIKLSLPQGTKTFTFHAVGGGGAGANIGNGFIQEPIIPANNLLKPEFKEQKTIIQHHLAEAFRTYAKDRLDYLKKQKENGHIEAGAQMQIDYIDHYKLTTLKDEDIVVFSGMNAPTKKGEIVKLNIASSSLAKKLKDEKHWILVNNDGTITVKTDVRFGLIYPHQLLKYTETLGSTKQKPIEYYMPRWFEAGDINKKEFRLVASVHSSKGAKGGSFSVDSIAPCEFLLECGACDMSPSDLPDGGCCRSHEECACKDTNVFKDIVKNKSLNADTIAMNSFKNQAGNTTGYAANINNELITYKSKNILIAAFEAGPGGAGGGSSSGGGNSGGGSGGDGGGGGECPKKTVCDAYTKKIECHYTPGTYFGCSFGGGRTCYGYQNGFSYISHGCDSAPPCATGKSKSCRNDFPFNAKYNGGEGGDGASGWMAVDIDETKFTSILAGCGRSAEKYNKNTPPIQDYLFDNQGNLGGSEQDGKNVDTTRGDIWKANDYMGNSCSNRIVYGDKVYTLYAQGGQNGQACENKGPNDCGFLGSRCDGLHSCPDGAPGNVRISPNPCGTPRVNRHAFSSVCNDPDSYRIGTVIRKNKVPDGYYNHIYLWTIPYALDYLGYGESGQAGEHKSTQKSDVIQNLYITLGEGGKNTGESGKPTIIKYGENYANSKVILTANGGKAGSSNYRTNNFNMCFNAIKPSEYKANKDDKPSYYCSASPDLNKDGKVDDNGVFCCTGSTATKSTNDITSTAPKLSQFDKMAASMNNSNLVGIGLGRSGEGIGSSTFNEEMIGTRYAVNSSTDLEYKSDDKIIVEDTSKFKDGKPQKAGYYRNYTINPAHTNQTAGGGAVIILW